MLDPVTPPTPDQNDPPALPDASLVPPPSILESASLVKPDGTFVENWHQNELLPEEFRGHKSLEVIKNLPDLIKRTINAESMIGKNKIVAPTEKSTPAEWAAYYDAGGRPKAPDDYKFDVPADLKTIFTDERMATARKLAHAEGFSQKQFAAYLKNEVDSSLKILQGQDQEEARQRDEGELALKKEWGAAYDERLHVAKRLVAEAFGNNEGGRLAFLEEFGNHPAFIRFAATMGAKLVEHKALIATYEGVSSPAEAQAKISQLRGTPGYIAYDGSYTTADGKRAVLNAEERQRITDQIREQYKLAYPEPAARKAG